MTSPGSLFRRRALPALALALALCASFGTGRFAAAERVTDPVAPRADEIRALWVLRTSLTSPDSITTLVRSAREHGFNTLFVQVRGRGDAYFRGGIEPRPSDLARQPESFDPLQNVIAAAHAGGLRVHAWINVNLVSSAADLPAAREHIVYRHPLWLMVPRDIAQEMATIDPESPAYVGKLARWTRTQSAEIEGLYASPILPQAAAYTESIVADIATRYDLDGVHFDYARYPSDRFDYSAGAIREFRASIRPTLSVATRRTLDANETVDLFAYPDALPDEWRAFRVARMTSLMSRLHTAVRRVRPDAVVSVAAAPDMREALEHRLQDWGSWLKTGLVDALCPMAYTPEPARFAEQIAAAREAAGDRPVWAGIGAYRLSPAQTIENIQTARRLGAAGVILFSYDSLTNPRQTTPDYLSLVGRGAFTTGPATSGSR
ncbi:MAG TPA: family 10 glycosylhydrolase [Vicinamibacterales bacterium]